MERRSLRKRICLMRHMDHINGHFSAFVQRKFSMPNTERHLLWRSLRGQTKDRKSTRLNSSHVSISYAVFCSKKKKLVSSTTVRHNVTSVRIEVLTDR